MSTPQPSDTNEFLSGLGANAEGQPRGGLLYPLNLSVLILSLLGLVVMLGRSSEWFNFVIVGLSLAVNLLVFWLQRRQLTLLAAHIFSHWVNLGVVFFFISNLFTPGAQQAAILFAGILAMSVMLAGMLLGSTQAFAFVVVDSLIVLSAYVTYYLALGLRGGELLGEVLALAMPINGFLLIIAVISWLYQRALGQASARLELARQRILRDELLRRDLAIARELQQRLYPPPPLTDANLRIASRSEPARETSGDFYDFIELGEGRLGIVVADVTGKSLAAALVMAMARGTLRSEATRHASAAEVLRSANQTLCQDHSVKQMITAFYGVLDTRTLTFQISNAGHPFPVLRRDGRLEELEICGLPLGARPDALYSERSFQLQPGDQLVILSDGLIEEHSPGRELFGFDRLNEAIAAAAEGDPEHALDDIWQTVARFRGSAEQSDDITLVVLQVAPALQMPASGAQLPQPAAHGA